MKRKMRKYRDYLIEKLADREEAISYLQTALEEYQTDGDSPAFLLALRSVVEAQGGIQEVARRAHADPQNLLRALSSEGETQIGTIGTVLKGLECRLSIEPLEVQISNLDVATH